jgi:ribokinase
MENSKNKITVLGSANYDTFIKVDRTPEMGETISSNSLIQACGGKGANQAAAIGKLGFSVDFVGQIGNDSQGKILADDLKKFGVMSQYLKVLDNHPTGQALILSYPNKDNSIIIVGGANMDWSQNDLKGLDHSISTCK